MTTLEFHRLGFASGARETRVLDWVARAGADGVGERTIWSLGFQPEWPPSAARIEDRDLLAGERVAGDDVVLLHDPLAVDLAPAIRDHGAHALWLGAGTREPATRGVDAYVMSWRDRAVVTVAAWIPAAGLLAARQIALGPDPLHNARVAWDSLLADVVDSDRHDCVGGTIHVRPVVAAR